MNPCHDLTIEEVKRLLDRNAYLRELKEDAIKKMQDATEEYWSAVALIDEDLAENDSLRDSLIVVGEDAARAIAALVQKAEPISELDLLPNQPNYTGNLSDPKSCAIPSRWRGEQA